MEKIQGPENSHILVLAATHEPYDNRVYHKETVSLRRQYNNITMITPEGEAFKPAAGITLERFSARGRWQRIRELYKTARGKDVDICHCHEPDSLLAGVWLKQKTGCKLIYDSHEYHPESFSERFPRFVRGVVRTAMLRFERYMVGHCDYVITVNEDLAAKFRNWGAKVAVLPNYPSRELFAEPVPERKKEALLLTYVGTLTKNRGVLDVLEVCRRVQDYGINVEVSIVGVSSNPEFTRELKNFAEANQLKLNLPGHVPHQQVATLMKQSDIGMLLLHPMERYTKAEPVKLFEYMACGLPVISYRYPAVEGIITENQCGEMVEAMDLQAVTEIVLKWSRDETLRKNLGANGQEAFRKRYNWDVCERKLWKLYEELRME